MLRLTCLICFFSCFICVQDVSGQQYPSKNYSIQDGFPHSNVYRIFHDKRGFLWFSTDYGLCSFDGKTFNSNFNDSEGHLNYSILSISENSKGVKLISSLTTAILIMTDSNVSKLHLLEGQMPKNSLFSVEKNKIIWTISIDNKVPKYRLHKIQDNKISPYDLYDSVGSPVNITKIVELPNELLFPSTNGVYRVTALVLKPFLPSIVKGEVVDVTRGMDNAYWIGYPDKVVVIKDDKITASYPLKGKRIEDMFLDNAGCLWISPKEGGLLLIRRGVIEDISSLLPFQRAIVNDINQDFEGNIWVATYGSGVYMINSLDAIRYSFGGSKANIYSRAICGSGRGDVYIGSIGEIYHVRNGQIRQLPVHLLKPGYYVYSIKLYGNKLFICSSGGLIVKDLSFPYSESITKDASISIHRDRKGLIWVGGYSYLYQFLGGKLVRHRHSGESIIRRYDKIFMDSKGRLWCGTNFGTFIIEKDGIERTAATSKSDEYVSDFFEDSYGRIWQATNNGLKCYDGNHVRLFTKNDGLASNFCASLAEDTHNILWVGTGAGLNYIDLKSLTVKNMASNIYRDVILSLYCDGENNLHVGTASDIISINTNAINRKEIATPVYISYVKTVDNVINMPTSISLPYNERDLVIGFIGISYESPNLVEYRYKIVGLDNIWHYTANTALDLPLLPSGEYTFILNARKNRGKWSDDVVLKIVIATPIWKTWWFIGLCIFIVFIVLLMITRTQTIKQEKKKRMQLAMQNKIVYLKQQALSALINPHFIFNCMNSIQHYLNSNDNDKANSYLADFASLIRMTMAHAQDAFIGLDKEISRIKIYLSLEQLRFGDDLVYEISVSEALQNKEVRIPNMILQPYIENAIWHGIMPKKGKGKINVSFIELSPTQLKIVVVDDGIGISNGMKRKSVEKDNHFGMQLTKERLSLLKELSHQLYTIEVKDRIDSNGNIGGTIVEISMPMDADESVIDQLYEDTRRFTSYYD